MKILQIRSEFRDNGPGSQALTLGRELAARGHSVVFVASGGELVPEIVDSGFGFHKIDTLAVDRRRPLDILKTVAALRPLMRREKPDVVHAHNAASVMLSALAARMANQKPTYVQSVRGIELRPGYQWRNWIYRVNPAALLAVSDFTKRQLEMLGARSNRIHVTYNGVDLARFDPDRVDAASIRHEFDLGDAPILGHVGNFSGWKGQDVLVRAAALLKPQFPELRVVLVGKGPDFDRVREIAKSLDMESSVVFAGFRRDIPEFQAAFTIYCQPSTQGEMFPNAIVEAMAMRNCWVGSDISGLGELTAEGTAGRVLEPGNVEHLAEALAELLADPEMISERGSAARAFVDANLTVGHVTDRIERVYRAKRR